jgi:hypothetical protein
MAEFVGSGPRYPDETASQAMGQNTAYHLAGHLLARRIQGISHVQHGGRGFGHESLDDAEKAPEHVATEDRD